MGLTHILQTDKAACHSLYILLFHRLRKTEHRYTEMCRKAAGILQGLKQKAVQQDYVLGSAPPPTGAPQQPFICCPFHRCRIAP